MTGFESKRKVAQAKLDDEAQGYIAEYEAALLISYQRGFADGKQAAQRKPLTDEQLADFLGDEYHTMTAEELRYFRLAEAAHDIKE